MIRLPLGPTLLVAPAIPLMIALGFWQLDRREGKEALLARLAANADAPTVALPAVLTPDIGFRRVVADCARTSPSALTGGRTVAGVTGYRHQIVCVRADGAPILVAVGVSTDPTLRVTGPLPSRFTGPLVPRDGHPPDEPPFLLVAETAVPPLAPAAPPTVEDIPNSHLSYAFQWFLFAATLGIVYAVYVRRWRLTDRSQPLSPRA